MEEKIKGEKIIDCDLEDLNKLDMLCKKISSRTKKIDGFVHCAGINNCVKISQISIKEWNKVFSINLTSAFIISKNFKKLIKIYKSIDSICIFYCWS